LFFLFFFILLFFFIFRFFFWAEIERTDVRCVVLTGAGEKAFCVGADVSAQAVDKTGLEYWADLEPNGFGGFSLRETPAVPVIARVNGYALGGGTELDDRSVVER